MASRLRQSSSPKISFFAFQDIITAVSGILILIVLMLAAGLDKDAAVASNESNPELQNRLAELLAEQTHLEIETLRLRETLAMAHSLPDTHQISIEVDALRNRLQQTRQRTADLKAEAESQEAATRQQDTLLGLADLRSSLDKLRRDADDVEKRVSAAAAIGHQMEEQVRDAQSKLLMVKAREGQLWLVPGKDTSTMEPVLVTVSGSGLLVDRFDKPAERVVVNASSALAGIDRQLEKFNKANQYLVFLIRPSGIELFEEVSEAVRGKGFSIGFDAIAESKVVHFSKPNESDWFGGTSITNPPLPTNPKPVLAGTNAPPKAAVKATTPAAVPKTESWWRRLLRTLGF